MTQRENHPEILREEILRELENYSIEVLEMALRMIQSRQPPAPARSSN